MPVFGRVRSRKPPSDASSSGLRSTYRSVEFLISLLRAWPGGGLLAVVDFVLASAPALHAMANHGLHAVGEGGLQYGGWHIPEGTEVALSWGLTNRDPKLYGPGAEEWRPERWLDEAHAREFEKFNATWGYGAYVCLGKNLALMEIYKTTVQVIVPKRTRDQAADEDLVSSRV